MISYTSQPAVNMTPVTGTKWSRNAARHPTGICMNNLGSNLGMMVNSAEDGQYNYDQ